MSHPRLGELSNVQLNHYYQGNPHYLSAVAKDLIPRETEGKFLFINMQSNHNGPGTHWVLLYNVSPTHIYYFDPMGIIPPEPVCSIMKESGKIKTYSLTDVQPLDSSSCGWFCIYVADHLLQGETFTEITQKQLTDDPQINQHILYKYFSHAKTLSKE